MGRLFKIWMHALTQTHTRFVLLLFKSFDEKVELLSLHRKVMPLFSLCSDLVSHYIWIWIFSLHFLNEPLFLCPTVHFSLMSSSPCLFASLSPSFAPSCSPSRSHNDLPVLSYVSPTLLFDVINLWERIRWPVVADWFAETYLIRYISSSCSHCLFQQYVLLCLVTSCTMVCWVQTWCWQMVHSMAMLS